MNERPDREQSALRIWLRIAFATLVVVGLVVITAARNDSETGSDFVVLDGRSGSRSIEQCGEGAARRVARVWFRGMSSREVERVGAVTSRGKPIPRYVITVEQGGGTRTERIRTRRGAEDTVPALVDPDDDLRLLEIAKVGRPPKTSGVGNPLSGRLAGIEFRARVGKTQWSGKVGVRCGNESAYFASFAISDP